MPAFTSSLHEALKNADGQLKPSEWRVLCLAFADIDVEFPGRSGKARRFRYTMRPEEIEKARLSFLRFPILARECSCGLADISFHIEHAARTLTTLTPMGEHGLWPSPRDVATEINEYAPPGSYDSIFVLWPQSDPVDRVEIPTAGWGLAIGPGHIPGGATYCSIANAPEYSWDVPLSGEVWLHEWLHGICDFYESKGFRMPEHNADGGSSHGYFRSPITGWCRYYRDLMTGRVKENGRMLGITPEAWLNGTIRSENK